MHVTTTYNSNMKTSCFTWILARADAASMALCSNSISLSMKAWRHQWSSIWRKLDKHTHHTNTKRVTIGLCIYTIFVALWAERSSSALRSAEASSSLRAYKSMNFISTNSKYIQIIEIFSWLTKIYKLGVKL